MGPAVWPAQAQHERGRRETCHAVGSASLNRRPRTANHQWLRRHRGFETDD